MNERAKAGVYWPGITKDIEMARASCTSCNRIMPSQARTPPLEPWIPSTPFEAIACDYFNLLGYYYFAAADRLSGWLEVQQIKVGTNEAGAQGLCKALRRLMVTFGVPIEVSSDGGPEFKAGETKSFFNKWGIRHRLSSVSFPSSNGRAELAVKAAKRLLMDNISPNGSLDNDAMVRALLVHRNTPDPGCKLSPAQILLGHPLRDTLPWISKDVMVFNNPEITPQWKEAWSAKEEALRARYVKTLENLSEHSRPLPALESGDHVMVQNQSGRFPKKWDKSGIVLEAKGNDQYAVKVAGSGRLTLRNRRFLRKYVPHFQQAPEWGFVHEKAPINYSRPQITAPGVSMLQPPVPAEREGLADTHHLSAVPPASIGLGGTKQCPPNSLPQHVSVPVASEGNAEMHQQSPVLPASIGPGGTRTRLLATTPPAAIDPDVTRRPTRERKQRQLYDASTGKYVDPCAVSEEFK